MFILGLETSCDETAAAIIEGKCAPTKNLVSVRSNIISSQIDIHKKYGGVVPEVAAREHVSKILPVVNEAIIEAGIKTNQANKKIKAIAVSAGPGLITSLLVGLETAKTLAYVWRIPLISVNHIEAHIYANFIGDSAQIKNLKFPAIILTASGGHTMLVLMRGHGRYKTIGETRDDAAGEAFDKAAQLLGLGYPGGPIISGKAQNRQAKSKNLKSKITLPRPMIESANFDFSFSGLKTALLYTIKKDHTWKKKIPDYCYEFQQAIIDVLVKKTISAAKKYKAKTVMLTGGVAANKELRKQMSKTAKEKLSNVSFIMPNLKYTTDNAAMVATAGYFKALRKKYIPWQKTKVDCNLKLK